MTELATILLEYAPDSMERAIDFYDRSPDGQYDTFVSDVLRALLRDMACLQEFLDYRKT